MVNLDTLLLNHLNLTRCGIDYHQFKLIKMISLLISVQEIVRSR